MADLAVSTPLEQTLALIKPDAVAAGNANDIVQLTLRAGFTVASKRVCQVVVLVTPGCRTLLHMLCHHSNCTEHCNLLEKSSSKINICSCSSQILVS